MAPYSATVFSLLRHNCPSQEGIARPRPHTPALYKTALAYLAAGCSIVPIAPGCKAPSLMNPRTERRTLIPWERYQHEPATPDEVRRWFAGSQPVGLGIVAGPVSGVTLPDGTQAGLEFLDIDDTAIHDAFVARLAAQGVLSLLQRLPCEETPRGGRHYGYLCSEWGVSTVLAQRRLGAAPKARGTTVTLIETRGQGGLCVVAPTPPGIHPTHHEHGYTMVRGTWTAMPLITPKARQLLWACARMLDEVPRQVEPPSHSTARLPVAVACTSLDPPLGSLNRRNQ
jgi:Bifunctional DNA primase/polymerase, N-terminal